MILVGTAPRGGEDIMHLEKPRLAKYIQDPGLQGYAPLAKIFFALTDSSQAAGEAFVERLMQRKQDLDPASGPNVAAAQMASFRDWEQFTGAHFAEVGVDADTAEIRLRRMLGVFAVGRVLNAKTARSQLIGGMTWGMSMALYEEAVMDTRVGAFVNRDLAQYLMPVHADIRELDAVLLDDFDDKANVLGVKGLGELGICGSGAAVANAVFNATGVRVREFPITLEKVLSGLTPV